MASTWTQLVYNAFLFDRIKEESQGLAPDLLTKAQDMLEQVGLIQL